MERSAEQSAEVGVPERWTPVRLGALAGRRYIVTGAASGLGYATAAVLAARGADVVIADRDVEGGTRAAAAIRESRPHVHVEFRALDLGSLAAIRRFASEQVQAGPLDGLVNVAGLLPPARRATTRDGFELKFGVNHLGHFALTGLLLDALLASPSPRVVSVSSIVHRRGRIHFDDLQAERRYAPQRAYSQAKLACLMFALELDRLARNAGRLLHSVAAHPGIARTAIGRERRAAGPTGLRDRMEVLALDFAMRWFGQPPEQGAWPLLYAAAAPEAQSGAFYGPGGFAEFAGHPARVAPAARAQDPQARARLWRLSEDLTGVRYDALRRDYATSSS